MIRCKVSRRGDKSFQRKSSERGRDREGDENKGSGWGMRGSRCLCSLLVHCSLDIGHLDNHGAIGVLAQVVFL